MHILVNIFQILRMASWLVIRLHAINYSKQGCSSNSQGNKGWNLQNWSFLGNKSIRNSSNWKLKNECSELISMTTPEVSISEYHTYTWICIYNITLIHIFFIARGQCECSVLWPKMSLMGIELGSLSTNLYAFTSELQRLL